MYDTPNSLIEHGHLEKGKLVLRKIRGIDNIEPEYMEIVKASKIAQKVKDPFTNLLIGQKLSTINHHNNVTSVPTIHRNQRNDVLRSSSIQHIRLQ